MPTSAPACTTPAIVPSTRPLRDSTDRFMPSETCVCSTVWNPRLPRTTQGTTVQKLVASAYPAMPTPRTTSASAVRRCCDMRYSSAVMKISSSPGTSRIAVM